MTRIRGLAVAVWLSASACGADGPLLYLPFDGSALPAISGAERSAAPAASLSFQPGLRGQCARLNADCRLATAGHFDARAGTVAFWLRPHWPGADKTGRYLFCLYGSPTLKESWLRNRWSVHTASGTLTSSILGGTTGQAVALKATINTWQQAQWHHVAFTWANINSGRADAECRLYLDGQPVQKRAGVRLDVGPVADTLDIGRDSDASPDYADADYDEFYIYGRALSAAEIARAVSLAKAPQATASADAPRGQWRADWWNDALPFRCKAAIQGTKPDVAVRLPFDVAADLNALGCPGAVDPASVCVVPCDARTGECARDAKPLPALLEERALTWMPPPATGLSAVHVYFDIARFDTTVPLFVRAQRRTRAAPQPKPVAKPDYARDTYGDAWDFDEGDFEAIDQWGNRPWCLRNRKVANGVLSFDVSGDPWFVWGNMWDQVASTQRPVAIDLAKYPILEMRVRQSCPSAEWTLYARPGSPNLIHHNFRLTGTGWQIVRINLVTEARWRGVLDAFRIDPTSHVKDAHVEIDWVRLTNEIEAAREPVETLGSPDRKVAALALAAERTRAVAGSRQQLVVLATDATGQPVSGQPVTVRLTTRYDGRLEAAASQHSLALGPHGRRGLTDVRGRLVVAFVGSTRAGDDMDVVEAEADFTPVRSPRVAVDALLGPPHHYQVAPARAMCLPEDRFPITFGLQLVDERGNPLPIAGRRVTLAAPKGATLTPTRVATDARGRAQATLRVDTATRWVYHVEASDKTGCSGTSAKLTVALTRPRPNPIRLLPNGYFAYADGRPFVPLGGFYANWVQSDTGDGEWRTIQSFTYTTDEQKRRWLKFLADNGVTALRFMLRTHHRDKGLTEAMDIGGRVSQGLLADAVRYMGLAREFDIQFLLVLHDDYTKPVYYNEKHFRHFTLPAFEGEDLDALPPPQRRFVRDHKLLDLIGQKYTDPDVLACQDMYARELVPTLRTNPQVFAYELENEMVNCPAAWANHAIATIRSADKATPVCVSHGGGGLHTGDPLWWHRNTSIDFYTYHLYPHGGSTSAEFDYGAAVDVLTRYGRMCGPCFMGESSGDQFSQHPRADVRRWVMRDIIWMALTSGNPGVFFWNARGSEIKEFGLARRAMAQLDLAAFRRAKPEIGIDVRHPLDDDKWFRTPEGRQAYAMMGRYAQHYLGQGVDFDFTVEPTKYAQRCDLKTFAPPAPKAHPFRIGKGWQLKALPRHDWREALVYVRNVAGIELWESPGHRGSRWRQYLRTRRPAPLRIALHLPDGRYRLHMYDLDAQTEETRRVAANTTIDLGTTDHDFAFVLKRR